ncbi:MAG TPA: hypothetical protein VGG03_12240 [Thermoanaerobaculia bacterium]|jgi:hypothetical protein
MENDLITGLAEFERRYRRLRVLLLFNSLALLAVIAALAASCASSQRQLQGASPGSLRVSEIVVVDERGLERARIGSDLPDAIIGGKRAPRGQKAAGILLYDDQGQERGGYVTFSPSGNVALTLDSRQGQVALFAADPAGGSALRLWHGNGSVELRADGDGARVTATREKRVMFQEPPILAPEKTEVCSEIKGLKSHYSDAQLLGFCQEHMTEAACRKCLNVH